MFLFLLFSNLFIDWDYIYVISFLLTHFQKQTNKKNNNNNNMPDQKVCQFKHVERGNSYLTYQIVRIMWVYEQGEPCWSAFTSY